MERATEKTLDPCRSRLGEKFICALLDRSRGKKYTGGVREGGLRFMGIFADASAAAALAPVRGLEIVYRPLADLVPYVNNARTHTAGQIAKLAASLARFGWTTPILIAGRDVLAGHARLAAALSMQRSGRPVARHSDPLLAPTIDLSGLSPAERKAYIIADNKLAQDAGWDNKLLRIDIESLRLGGFDLSLTGFGPLEIKTLLGVAGPAEGPRLSDGMRYQVVVECDGEAHQARVLTDLAASGLKVRPLIL